MIAEKRNFPLLFFTSINALQNFICQYQAAEACA